MSMAPIHSQHLPTITLWTIIHLHTILEGNLAISVSSFCKRMCTISQAAKNLRKYERTRCKHMQHEEFEAYEEAMYMDQEYCIKPHI